MNAPQSRCVGAQDDEPGSCGVPVPPKPSEGATAAVLRAEVDRLIAWKVEAMTVLREWEQVWVDAGRPGRLGCSKAAGVRAELARLRACNAALEEAVACWQAHAEELACTAAERELIEAALRYRQYTHATNRDAYFAAADAVLAERAGS